MLLAAFMCPADLYLCYACAKWPTHDVQVFDDYLQQLGEDTAAYVRTVCQTIVLTVPKAVIHCQVGASARLLSVPACLQCVLSRLLLWLHPSVWQDWVCALSSESWFTLLAFPIWERSA